MRKITLFWLILVACCLHAQDTIRIEIYDAMESNVTVHADSLVNRLLYDRINGVTRKEVQMAGYRVQVYSSNSQQEAKQEAFNLEKRIIDSGLEIPTYVLYQQPFWKVRLGNFRTQEEAALFKAEIIRLFPDLQANTYIVRDQILVISEN